MADLVKFSDLKDSQPLTYNGTQDLLAIAVVDNNSATGYSTMTTSPTRLAQHAVEEVTFANLKTSANTVEGSINQTISNLANDYDPSSTYAVDDCVLHEGDLYQCTTAITVAEAWDSTHWTQVKAVDVGAGGGGNADYVELTQLEYDALTPAQKTNGKMYFITDTNGNGSQFQPVIYSETEREIGVYTDGKPLYEKTYLFGVSDLDGGTQSSSKISGDFILGDRADYDAVWIESSYLLYKSAPSNGVTMVSTGLNYPKGSEYIRSNVQANSVTGKLVIFMELTYSANVYYPVRNDLIWVYTIRYTKTTDTAGSGTWTPQGVPAHHYSTTEQVVGTWIDGSTLYEKTVYYAGGVTSSEVVIPHGISNLNRVCEVSGTIMDSDVAGQYFVIPRNQSSICFSKIDSTNITITSSTQMGNRLIDWCIVIRYTKSSS